MSEFVWYTRLAVWTGSLILIAQSVTGHSPSFMTLFAVLCVSLGLVGFVGGLAMDGLRERSFQVGEEHAPAPAEPDEPIAHTPPEQQAQLSPSMDEQMAEEQPLCGHCRKPLSSEPVFVTCSGCGAGYHTGCWEQREGRCATPGCIHSGAGEAVSASTADSSDRE